MTDQRELDQILGRFLVQGSETLADRVLDAALDQVGHTRQRPTNGSPRRMSTMRYALVAAAGAIAVATIGTGVFGSGMALIGDDIRHTAAPTSGPTSPASVMPSQSLAAQRAGYILLEHYGNSFDGTTTNPSDERHLWLVKADGTDLHELAPGQPVSEPPVTGKGPAAWSPDGLHIAFEASQNGALIYETDISGGVPRLLSTDCPPASCGESFPAYSPDGKRLAFVRSGKGNDLVVGVRDLATGKASLLEPTRLSTSLAWLGAPSWSPDGTQLVYHEIVMDADGKPTGVSHLYVVNADGSGLHSLPTPYLGAGDPAWSPDGSVIVFSTYPIHAWTERAMPGRPDIYSVKPDGTGLRALTGDHHSGAPSWTSDGKILYSTHSDDLWLMDPDGSNQQRVGPGPRGVIDLVSTLTGYSYYAHWQPTP